MEGVHAAAALDETRVPCKGVSGDADGEALAGGSVSRAVLIQGNVHREAGPWTLAIHELLRHLEHAGFDGAPRVVGFDDRGREVLTYVEGEAGSLQLPPALLHEHGIRALGRFIRGFHDAVARRSCQLRTRSTGSARGLSRFG
jgi:hypothetical protein